MLSIKLFTNELILKLKVYGVKNVYVDHTPSFVSVCNKFTHMIHSRWQLSQPFTVLNVLKYLRNVLMGQSRDLI